ncbi:MAG: alpha/beta hydrolase [bacterium]|nr:alpha/beta hydrolase [bacterium]
MVGVVNNYKKMMLLGLSFSWLVVLSTYAEPIRIGTYGDILEQDSTVKNVVVEQVMIYPQENEHSSKRIARKGILVLNKGAQATILISHGFMCDKYAAGFLRYIFPRDYYNFMTFDFRAHGENVEGQYCTFGRDEAYDVIAAARFLRNHPDLRDKPLIAYGFSMGAVASIEAQAKDATLFDAMILDCPFDTSENVIKKGLEGLKFYFWGYEFNLPGKSLLEKYAFHPYVQRLVKFVLKTVANFDDKNIRTNILPLSPVESIKHVTIPCFFIHCKHDEKVSVNAIKEIYNSAAGYKMLWLTNGRKHFDSFFYSPEKYSAHIKHFLKQAMTGRLTDNKTIVEDIDDKRISKKG